MGRPFNAIIQLNDENAPQFDFGQGSAGSDGTAEEVDFSQDKALGVCPKCAANVFAHGMAYVCEKSVGPAKACDFRSGTVILQQTVEPEQMQKLLANGRTDLLKDFVSARTRRKFSAYLVRGTDGKVGFEFEKRAPKPAAKTARSTEVKVKPGEAAAPTTTTRRRKVTG